jgi:predicted DNA-binding transcriptional regulator YafY
VLAPHERSALDGSSFYIEPARDAAPAGLGLAEYRRALREQRKIRVLWQGEDGEPSSRIVWPIMLGFAGKKRSFAAWCETRGAYDLFTAEKIVAAEILADRYPRSRRVMVAEWRAIAAEHCNATVKD